MQNDESTTSQLRFEDGGLVEAADGDSMGDEHAVNPVEPGKNDGFVLEARSGALEVNSDLREAVESHGHTLEFASKSGAKEYARQLSASGGHLKVQDAPENEPRDIDAYLLAEHNPSIDEPATINGDTWTFEIGANLYGMLGEALLLHAPKPHAIVYFVQQDLEVDDSVLEYGLKIEVDGGSQLSVACSNERARWTPDCVVEARDGWGGEVLERYYCEIKSGDASFERSQVNAMEKLSEEKRVLKIRVKIGELPDQYSLRIHEVDPSG